MKFTTIVSGSSGNCIYIEGGATALLVDAGCSNRCLVQALAGFGRRPEQIAALLITHEHRDHISGALRFARRFGIPVYASELTWEKLPFRNDFFREEQHIFEYGMKVGEIEVDFFRLAHDAVQPVGFVFSHQGQRVGVATDTGIVTPSMARLLANADGMIFEANHDYDMLLRGPYPYPLKRRVASENGHLSNQQAGLALRELIGERTQAVLLAHLSETNNRPELALAAVQACLEPFRHHLPAITVAPRYTAHPLIELQTR